MPSYIMKSYLLYYIQDEAKVRIILDIFTLHPFAYMYYEIFCK